MAVSRAILWMSEEAEGSKYPMLLQEVLFKPLLRWVSDALMAAGASSFCFVRADDRWDAYLSGNISPELPEILLLDADAPALYDDLLTYAQKAGDGFVAAMTAPALITAHALDTLADAHAKSGSTLTELLSDDERSTGLYGFLGRDAGRIFSYLGSDGFPGALSKMHADGLKLREFFVSDGLGGAARVQTALELHMTRRAMQTAVVERHMRAGVQILDPAQTYIGADVLIGRDTTLLPGVMIYGETLIGEDCEIGPFSVLQDCVVGDRCSVNASQLFGANIGSDVKIGPYAYLRPGCVVGNEVKIGDFVELKNSTVGSRSKIPHLSYVGDADIGEHVNIGCGAITVNYDGRVKHRTTVETDAFIGCNTNLVAPVTIGKGAFTAAGSTITGNVPEGALAIARVRQENKEGWVEKRRPSK